MTHRIVFYAALLGVIALGGCKQRRFGDDASETSAASALSSVQPSAVSPGESTATPVPTGLRSLRFVNPKPPAGSRDPLDGATNVYVRSSDGSRHSPFDLEIQLFDARGTDISAAHALKARVIYASVYLWNLRAWESALAGRAPSEVEDLLANKKNAFWESLAQWYAERILGKGETPAALKFGPECLEKSCPVDRDKIAAVHRVVVTTTVHGERDPLNPVTRTIRYEVTAPSLSNPKVELRLEVPAGLRVASVHEESLDFVPTIRGIPKGALKLSIVAKVHESSQTRTRGTDYPDFNKIFIPARHFVLQGQVADPMRGPSSLTYGSVAELQSAFAKLVETLKTPSGAQSVASRLKAFLTPKYYYMFGDGVSGYASYILGSQAGIAKGLAQDFSEISLRVDETKLR